MKKNIVKDIEARVMPWSILFLLIGVVMSSVFILVPEIVHSDEVGEEPSESWYTYAEYGDDTDTLNVTDYRAYGGTQSLFFPDQETSSGAYQGFYLNLTSYSNYSSIEFYMYQSSTTTYWSPSFFNNTEETTDSLGINEIPDANEPELTRRLSSPSYTPWENNSDSIDMTVAMLDNKWTLIKWEFNYTTHKQRLTCGYNVSDWEDFTATSVDNLAMMRFQSRDTYTCRLWIDNITLTDWDSTTYTEDFESTPTGSTYAISGYSATNFLTWTGEGGQTVWSNATSDGTLEINYDVNATDNLTNICINMDADDMDAGFSDENITIYVSFDNSTFAVLEDDVGNGNGVCANGYNLTINATTYPSSDPGGDPNFPIDPVGTWENDTIYVRFTLAIPSGMSPAIYSSANTDWSVDYKVET